MSRLTERTRYGIVGNNDRVINYPLYKIADADPLDRRIVGQCFDKLADYEDAEEQGLLLRLKPMETELLIMVMNTYRNDYPLSAILNESAYKEFNDLLDRLYEAENKLAEMKGE